jgi:hypothetical protein
MKMYKCIGSEGRAPSFLTSETDRGERPASLPVLFSPREKSPEYSLDRGLGESGRCAVAKIFFPQ